MRYNKFSDMIQLQGVSYTYPDSACPSLQGIDLTVPDGEWLLLAGPSGGGKSTLLYVLNGLIPHVLGGEVRGDVRGKWPRACKCPSSGT